MKKILFILLMVTTSVSFSDTVYRGMDQNRVLFKSIPQLKVQGYISTKPQITRYDYNDVYQMQKPLIFLNQSVVLVSDEYMSEYIGCCVSEGWGAVFKVNRDYDSLRQFAEENYCSLEEVTNSDQRNYRGFPYRKLGKGKFVELSCRERDIQQ